VLATPTRNPTRKRLIDWWVHRIGDMPLARIAVADLRPLLDAFAETHKPATCNRLKAACSSVFRHAIREGWLTRNPACQKNAICGYRRFSHAKLPMPADS